jgi:Rps23 Pro-64 3,4-dihydroxylase Tpa1-like proline 4-hydroxylase
MAFTYTIEPNFLSKEECNEILNFSLNELKLVPSEIVGPYLDGNIDINVRKSNQVFYPYYEKFPFLLEKMSKLLNEYIFVKGFDLDFEKSEFQFTEYHPGGHFKWHKDVVGNKITNYNRYSSLVIQLNDEYEEGNLQIKDNKNETLTIEKGTGNLILFLSNIEHRVTPVKSGIRYTLVNWVKLIENKNYKKTLI